MKTLVDSNCISNNQAVKKELNLLRFITCGSVDDGKSTLIGHMLFDSKLIFADQAQALMLDSKIGSNNGQIDYSLLLDGLIDEREQGITIDVAYRYFSTNKRNFIVADCPGHEQYTRNMVVGASNAELAIILIDGTKGVLKQTKRHAKICYMLGIRDFLIVINKMDLLNYEEKNYRDIVCDFNDVIKSLESNLITKHIIDHDNKAEELNIKQNYKINNLEYIPISATIGDNISRRSDKMDWYQGTFLLDYLENINIKKNSFDDLIIPIQRVSRPNSFFRGYQGRIESGEVNIGDKINVYPNYQNAVVKEVLIGEKKVKKAVSGNSISVVLDREIDISRGSVITKSNLKTSDLIKTTIVWFEDTELKEGRNYLLKCGTKIVNATIIKIRDKFDIDTYKKIKVEEILPNDIVECEISLSEHIVCDSFDISNSIGRFILINKHNNNTSACGIIDYTMRRSNNLFWNDSTVTKELRSSQKCQKPITIWLTGLSGSGKSTIGNALEKELFQKGKHTMLLDGDNIRLGLNKNLSFKESDRAENIRRIAEVSKLMNDAGLIVITAFISPYSEDRENAKKIIGCDSFIEVYLSTSLDECEKRDVKGLYKKARNGEIPNFTGVSSIYEKPTNPDLVFDTKDHEISEVVEKIIKYLDN